MMLFDMTVDPPQWVINEYSKTTYFDLLKPMGENGEGEDKEYVYDLNAMCDFTYHLMEFLGINYDPRLPENRADKSKLEDFSPAERRILFPFAFMLACIDGNCFRTGHLNPILQNGDKLPPSEETISYYIPAAYRIMKANSGSMEEFRQLIMDAAKTDQ